MSRTLVLVGGGTHVCSSAAPDACEGAPDFVQRSDLPLRDELGPRYAITPLAIAGLLARPELADAIKAGLPELPQDQPLTYDQLLDELDLALGLDLLPPDSAARASTCCAGGPIAPAKPRSSRPQRVDQASTGPIDPTAST